MTATVRAVKADDLTPMAEVFCEAFKDEELCGDFMHPHRHEHWNDYIARWRRDFRQDMFNPSVRPIVSVDEKGEVTGLAIWQRWGEGAKRMPYPLMMRLRGLYGKARDAISSLIWPDKSANPANIAAFYGSFGLFKHHWSADRAETWYLHFLAVHPAHQGKGHGKLLVKKGVEWAKEEGVVTSVISSYGADSFYNALGFVEVGRANIGPLASLKGGSIKFLE